MRNSDSAPIVFVHYGNNKYLEHTIRTAIHFNPEKEFILLGDESNKHLNNLGATFVGFDDYLSRSLPVEFKHVFQLIAGSRHGKADWVEFCFLRWFIAYSFTSEHRISRFWFFDSDTLILTALRSFEDLCNQISWTEQCNGSCIGGYIRDLDALLGYLEFMITMFQDTPFLEKQRKIYSQHPDWALTEMLAYKLYRKRAELNTIRLSTLKEGEFFDDCISQEHGMEMYSYKNGKLRIKQIYTNGSGGLFVKDSNSGRFLRARSLNMSWVTDDLVRRLSKLALQENATHSRNLEARESAASGTFNAVKMEPGLAERALLKTARVLDSLKN